MEFKQNNKVVQLCAAGMQLEGQGLLIEAKDIFEEAWSCATNDFEKLTAAHYLARHQKSILDKLKWDKTALSHALKIDDESIKDTLPSLYLNIGKCYEDMLDFDHAKSNYEVAFGFASFLRDDGYGNMIKAGIDRALQRIK